MNAAMAEGPKAHTDTGTRFRGWNRGLIQRENQILALLRYLEHYPAVAILGPRQVGKSTLARQIADRVDGPSRFYRLDTVRDRQRLRVPEKELAGAEGLVILDGVRHIPRIFPPLPKILESSAGRARFLLVGGSRSTYEQPVLGPLDGSIAVHELPGLSLHEVGAERFRTLWLRGGLPPSFTARSESESFRWRSRHSLDIIETDPERPGPQVAGETLHRFILTLAQHHGKVLDIVELARAFGVRNSTARRYLDILRENFVIRLVHPHLSGRRAAEIVLPKLFFCDTGVLHNLLGCASLEDLAANARAQLSWKGFAMESTIQRIRAGSSECFHWTIKTGQGLDLLVMRDGYRWGFEFQYGDRPRITPSMKMAVRELKLNRLDVIHYSEGPGLLESGVHVHTTASLPRSLRLPPGFERRPEFIELEKEPAEA